MDYDGVTPNDIPPGSNPPDQDTGPNQLQNFPILDMAQLSGSMLNVSGSLESTPSTMFRVEFFANGSCDPAGNGEGHRFVGAATVTANAQGIANFVTPMEQPVSMGEFLTSTATVVKPGGGYGDTSEFSACLAVEQGTGPTPTPTTLAECPAPYPDFNESGSVDAADLLILIKGLHDQNPLLDLTEDGVLNGDDVTEFSLSWRSPDCSK